MDFTTDVLALQRKLSGTVAKGGGVPQKMSAWSRCTRSTLSWRASTRCLCWIADAPAHGPRRPSVGDNHKNGDEKLDPVPINPKIAPAAGSSSLFRIKNITDKMIRVLRPRMIGAVACTDVQHELGDDPKLFLDKTMSSISQSVSVTVDSSRLLSLRGKRNKKTMHSSRLCPKMVPMSSPTPAFLHQSYYWSCARHAWNDSGWGDIAIVDVYTAARTRGSGTKKTSKVRVYKRAFGLLRSDACCLFRPNRDYGRSARLEGGYLRRNAPQLKADSFW